MADNFSVKLREENAHLLAQLKIGVSQLKQIIDDAEIETPLQIQKCKGKSDRIHAAKKIMSKAVVDEKLKLQDPWPKAKKQPPKPDLKRNDEKKLSKRTFGNGNLAKTSTPVQQKQVRVNLQASDSLTKTETVMATPTREPKSILITPARKIKTPRQRKSKVTFPTGTLEKSVLNDLELSSLREKSLLGYDWIAGTLDNESSICDQSDQFFEELKEFRRVNRDECISNKTQIVRAQNQDYAPKSPNKLSFIDDKENAQREDICCGSTYTIDGRLHPVPIHGPYSQCPVCKTKQDPEIEYDKSYIRVSVPRSTLQSPYRIRPHRRKSFDPSDSVALSEHCLAGWQSAKPAYAPGPDTLDLKASIETQSGLLSLGSGQNVRTGYQRQTEELLNTTIAMRHGLQLLEQRFDARKPANTTSYPAF